MKNLESANSHPSYALDHLKQLAKDVDLLIEKNKIIETFFAVDKSDAEISEDIETFL